MIGIQGKMRIEIITHKVSPDCSIALNKKENA